MAELLETVDQQINQIEEERKSRIRSSAERRELFREISSRALEHEVTIFVGVEEPGEMGPAIRVGPTEVYVGKRLEREPWWSFGEPPRISREEMGELAEAPPKSFRGHGVAYVLNAALKGNAEVEVLDL